MLRPDMLCPGQLRKAHHCRCQRRGGRRGFQSGAELRRYHCRQKRTFHQIFVRAVIPDLGGTYFLPRLVGLAKAKELMFTGDPINAEEALKLGLINRIVDDADLMTEATAFAKRLANGATFHQHD